METKIVNLTPHAIHITNEAGEIRTIEPSGVVARVSVTSKKFGVFDGVDIYKNEYGEVENLPAPDCNTMYIVSSLVASACKHRYDLVVPNDIIRDEAGRIIGCKSLAYV